MSGGRIFEENPGMKRRIGIAFAGAATLVMLAGLFSFPTQVRAQEQDDAGVQTMWVVPRGTVLILRLYDEPNPLGKTQKTIPAGQPIEVESNEMHNKYWYKTSEGYYAHFYYLTDVDPALDPEADRAAMSDEMRAREDELLKKYNNIQLVQNILAQKTEIGMSMDMIMDSWGSPDEYITIPGTMGDSYSWIYFTPPTGFKRTVIKFNERKMVISIQVDK